MKILLVDNHTIHFEELKVLLNEYGEIYTTLREEFNQEYADKFDLIVFSGGSNTKSVVNHPDVYQTLINFIQNTSKKVIGICLGCQIIAKAYDCKIVKNSEKIERNIKIKFDKQNFELYSAHWYSISATSKDIKILSKSKNGAEIIKHKTKEIWGLQFHPEVETENLDGKKIMDLILKPLT